MSTQLTNDWISIEYDGDLRERISADVNDNTGRDQRVAVIVAETSHHSLSRIVIRQQGKGEFIEMDNGGEFYCSYNGSNAEITGSSNCSCLDASAASQSDAIQQSYVVTLDNGGGDDIYANLGEDIDGDPGAEEQYLFSMTVSFDPLSTKDDYKKHEFSVCNLDGEFLQNVVVHQGTPQSE